MFKVEELYPKAVGSLRGSVYLTNHVKARIQRFFDWTERQGLTMIYAGALLGVSPVRLRQYKSPAMSDYAVPSVQTYMKMMKLCNIYLHKYDLNYAFVNVAYSREEIQERITRLYPCHGEGGRYGVYARLAREMGVRKEYVSRGLGFGKYYTLQCYGTCMTFIAEEEKKRGYKDALKVER